MLLLFIVKRFWIYYLYLLIAWTVFRYFVQLPEVIVELWFKPVIWLMPLFWWNLSMGKKKIAMFGNKWVETLTWGVGLGIGYWLIIAGLGNMANLEKISWLPVLLAFSTAVVEELTFSGFVAGYLDKEKLGEWKSALLVGLLVLGVRLPLLVFSYNLSGSMMMAVLLVGGVSAVMHAFVRLRTKNVLGSVLARTMFNILILG